MPRVNLRLGTGLRGIGQGGMGQDTLPKKPASERGPNADEVAAALDAQPELLSDILDRRPELLNRLVPPIERDDGVIDLQSFLLARLRGEVDGLRRQQRAIVSASRANHNSQNRVHAAILLLLDATSFEQLIQAATNDLPAVLGLDVACLLVEADSQDAPHAVRTGVQIVDRGFVARCMEGRSICLSAEISGDEAIYGEGAGLVRSEALVRLDISTNAPPAMLALGSRHADMFRSGLRTELLGFLAQVLERSIRGWLYVAD